jgi:hypothetical protein
MARCQGFVALRKAAGYTQATLADAMNVERGTIIRWEAGESTPQPSQFGSNTPPWSRALDGPPRRPPRRAGPDPARPGRRAGPADPRARRVGLGRQGDSLEVMPGAGGEMARDHVEPLVREVIRRQWTLLCFGHRGQPDALAAVHRDQRWTDVVILRGHDRAAAYRTPTQPHDDALQTSWIVWHYLANAEYTLRAVLNLSPDTATATPYPIPDECRIPETNRRPIIIRPGCGYPDAPEPKAGGTPRQTPGIRAHGRERRDRNP